MCELLTVALVRFRVDMVDLRIHFGGNYEKTIIHAHANRELTTASGTSHFRHSI